MTNPYYADNLVTLHRGDCLDVLRGLDDNSVDAVVTDPPYGLSNTKPAQVADVLAAWVTGNTEAVPGLKKDSLEDAFVKALKRSPVTDSDDLDSEIGKELVAFRVPLGVIPVSMFRPVNLNGNAPSGKKEIDGDGMGFKVEYLLRNDGDTEGGEGVSGNIFRLRRRSSAPCSVSREGDSARIRVSVWLGDNSFAESEGSSGVMAVGATEVVAMLSLDVGRGTAEFLPADSALPGDFILTRSGAESVGALTRTGGLSPVFEAGEVSEVDTSADGAGAFDVVVGLPMGWHESHSSTSKGFMGKTWDGFVPPPAVWQECLRVLKPGGHMAVFAGARTQDLMGLSIRLAGFELRDTLGWIYGSGFPKSMDVSKAIDKAAGAERRVVGHAVYGEWHVQRSSESIGYHGSDTAMDTHPLTTPATDEAKQWSGWGTALKPAIEPIILARKPLDGTVAANVLAHGVGGLNIDACRVGTSGGGTHCNNRDADGKCLGHGDVGNSQENPTFNADESAEPAGRFPANVLLDEHAAKEMDEQSGVRPGGTYPASKGIKSSPGANGTMGGGWAGVYREHSEKTPPGGASRFFPVFKYQAKAPKKERPVIVREDGTKIAHPTVKPLALLDWLVTLITPEGGTTLDPFAGTGTTLQAAMQRGVKSIGVEQDEDYIQLIMQRIDRQHAAGDPILPPGDPRDFKDKKLKKSAKKPVPDHAQESDTLPLFGEDA